MTLKQYMVAGVIEQAIMFGIILPATGCGLVSLQYQLFGI